MMRRNKIQKKKLLMRSMLFPVSNIPNGVSSQKGYFAEISNYISEMLE